VSVAKDGEVGVAEQQLVARLPPRAGDRALHARGSGIRRFEREERNRRERAQHEREHDTEQPSVPGGSVRCVARLALWPGHPPG
jgi:hypothetical protein